MKQALSVLLLLLCANVAWADPPSNPQGITALVQELLLKPLSKAESKRSRFSRAAPVAMARRVRVLAAHHDVRGQEFVRFAIDERSYRSEHDDWDPDTLIGCAYAAERKVFVQRGNQYVEASNAFGQGNKFVPDVCRPAPIVPAVVALAR